MCSYCHAANTSLVAPAALKDTFAPVVSIYEPAGGGKLLVELLQADWGMFAVDVQVARSLLGDILEDGQIATTRFALAPRYEHVGLHLSWEKLRDELVSSNRYFPDATFDKARLGELIGHLVAEAVPETWYRARLQQGDAVFPIDQMGAPPKGIASHGRANPPGIPYLYLGSAHETAIAEVRPHTGEKATVANFQLQPGLKLVDLRDPRRLVSPFVFGDEDQIASLRSDIPFIERLGQELTQPVLPHRAAIDYVPSQYLCEFIKKLGYDGVIYRSSVSTGMNLALFDPSRAVPGQVTQRQVTSVTVTIAP